MQDNEITSELLEWYKEYGRDLPWRYKGGAHPNPYVVLVSEFMLQQTTVKTVIPYFYRFMERFPTVETLANATEEEVYKYWQGLGYYTRARSLHTSAQIITEKYKGVFPNTREKALKLKGVGIYTVASYLALAFNQPETVVDGNVMRIICRMYHLTAPLDELKSEIHQRASKLVSLTNPADYTSAIMDLGATVCAPKNPQCLICPWQKYCKSANKEDVNNIPNKVKLVKRTAVGSVYLIYNAKGEILIRKRTEKGLLTGLYELPWCENGTLYPATDTKNEVTHIFTHIHLTLHIYKLKAEVSPISDAFFITPDELKNYPTSTLMKKVLKKLKLM